MNKVSIFLNCLSFGVILEGRMFDAEFVNFLSLLIRLLVAAMGSQASLRESSFDFFDWITEGLPQLNHARMIVISSARHNI